MKRITYFAIARNSDDKIEQVFVEKRDGKSFSQKFTGIIYRTEKEAMAEIGQMNQRFAHSALS